MTKNIRSWASTWDGGWTQGRSVGFLPSSLFYKDETGKLNTDRDVLFFMDWDSPDPNHWRSTVESPVVDYLDTPAERYDRRNKVGRFRRLRWAVGQDGHHGGGFLSSAPWHTVLQEREAWLLEQVKKMKERRNAFPEMIAIVNPVENKAYAMKFEKNEMISNSDDLILEDGDEIIKALGFKIKCDSTDAILVVRPYVRIIEGDGPVKGVLRFLINGEVVVGSEPIEKYIVKDMNDCALDLSIERAKNSILLYGVALTAEGADLGMGTYGIFAPTKSTLEVWLLDIRCAKDPIRVEVGCVAARYTTKLAAAAPDMSKAIEVVAEALALPTSEEGRAKALATVHATIAKSEVRVHESVER